MATTTTTTDLSSDHYHVPISWHDVFSELNDEIDRQGTDCHLNCYYLDFTDDDTPLSNFNQLPSYISTTNSDFQLTFFCELRSLYNPIDFDDLKQLTFFTHQMSLIHLQEQLWCRCLQACSGQIKPCTIPVRPVTMERILAFCPKFLAVILQSKGITIDLQEAVKFIQNYLRISQKKHRQYQIQFDELKCHLGSKYSNKLTEKIDRFVQKHGLELIRLHFQTQIGLMEAIGIDRLYQYEYVQQKPTEDQVGDRMFSFVLFVSYHKDHYFS